MRADKTLKSTPAISPSRPFTMKVTGIHTGEYIKSASIEPTPPATNPPRGPKNADAMKMTVSPKLT